MLEKEERRKKKVENGEEEEERSGKKLKVLNDVTSLVNWKKIAVGSKG